MFYRGFSVMNKKKGKISGSWLWFREVSDESEFLKRDNVKLYNYLTKRSID